MVLANFKTALRLRHYRVFRWHSLEILNVINNLSLKKVFRKIKIKSFFKNLEFLFSFESTMIENATFPCKTALSKVNFMTNRIRSKNGLISKTMILQLTTYYYYYSENLIQLFSNSLRSNENNLIYFR